MRADNKGVLAFGKALTQFIAQPVGLLWGYLARFERLPYLIGYNIVFLLLSAAFDLVNSLSQGKLRICKSAVALIAADELAVICLFRVLHIINNFTYDFTSFTAFTCMQRNKSCCCRMLITTCYFIFASPFNNLSAISQRELKLCLKSSKSAS